MGFDYSDISGVGTQPVRVLQHRIVEFLRNSTPTFASELETYPVKYGLKPLIAWGAGKTSIIEFDKYGRPKDARCAKADSTQQITIYETFLSYLWCISYGLIVIYDEGHARPSQNIPSLDPNIKHADIAQSVLDYGMRLIDGFEDWDYNLPNPEKGEEAFRFYVEAANGIFCEATKFILLHELAHVVNQDTIKAATTAEIIKQEEQADKWAIQQGFLGPSHPGNKLSKPCGLVAGLCSLMLLSRNLHGQDHPDNDARMKKGISLLNLDDHHIGWLFALLGIKIWDQSYSRGILWPKSAQAPKQYFLDTMDELQRAKHLNL